MSELLYTELAGKVPVVPVYEITNVRDYVKGNGMPYTADADAPEPMDGLETASPTTRIVDVKKVENIFPPFPSFWMEFRDEKDGDVIRGAILWEAEQTDGWAFSGTVFWDDDRGTAQFPFLVNMPVTKEGKPLKIDFAPAAQNIPEAFLKKSMLLGGTVCMTSLLAISFLNMHKKSVTVVNNPPSRQVRRAAERQGKHPPPTFKTIMVRGMGRNNRGGNGDGSGGRNALHIVRGYMLRGTAEKPLFGKPWGVGTFWVASHTRGKAKYGDTRNIPFKVKVAAEE